MEMSINQRHESDEDGWPTNQEEALAKVRINMAEIEARIARREQRYAAGVLTP